MRQPLDLWNLLPAFHRREDAERGYPLRALLSLIGEQGDVVRHGFDALWNDLFIETCDRWVIPYVGQLVANKALYGGDRREQDPYAELFADLAGPDLRPPPAVPLRADVAKTIYYRRRKGTPRMLEELAGDVTGWGAKVSEFFQLLEWTQNDDHLRLGEGGRPFPGFAEVRHVEPIDRLDGAFDRWAHTVDVRRTAPAAAAVEGWHNIDNVGFFLWRLASYPLGQPAIPVVPPPPPQETRPGVTPRPVDEADAAEWRFHFSPLGNPAPLFVNPRPFPENATGGGAPGGVARVSELHVPAPIRHALFYDDLVRYRQSPARPRDERTDLYGLLGDGASFAVWLDGALVPPVADPSAEPGDFDLHRRVVCRRLSPWPPRPTGDVVAIDPVSGRLALGDAIDPAADGPVEAAFTYGFSADLGGGPYERRAWLQVPRAVTVERTVSADPAAGADHLDLIAALAEWTAAPAANRESWIITLLDSRTYALPAAITLESGGALTVQAANRQRPLLRTAAGGLSVDSDEVAGNPDVAAAFTLSGVVLEGRLEVTGELRRLRLLHATLVPGLALDPNDGSALNAQPSLVVAGADGGDEINARLRLEMAFSISGGLRLPAHAEGLWIHDSIVDGARVAGETGAAIAGLGAPDAFGPPATLERVTVLGRSYFRALPLASETIFSQPAVAERRQGGCVRFSWVPPGSVTPRRFRCQPDLALEAAEAEAGGALGAGERAQIRRQLEPCFTDVRYGQPGYAQLSLSTAAEIRTGAEDGSEMGVFSHLQQPQRETNLRIRLDEYLPFGLTPGLIYVT